MSRRLRRELSVGLALVAVALAGAYWQAEQSDAFARDDGTGRALRLICPLH